MTKLALFLFKFGTFWTKIRVASEQSLAIFHKKLYVIFDLGLNSTARGATEASKPEPMAQKPRDQILKPKAQCPETRAQSPEPRAEIAVLITECREPIAE